MKIKTTFKDVPNDTVFYAYWNAVNPLECDTILAYKDSEGRAFLKGFDKGVQPHPDEPVFYHA